MLEKIKYSKKPEWLQTLLNLPYYSKECPPIHAKGIDFIIQDGCKFYPTGPLTVFNSVYKHSWYGIPYLTNKECTCLDIGACIGTVCIPLSYEFKTVIAIEPIWNKELEDNIKLNNRKNIEVRRQFVGGIWPLFQRKTHYAGKDSKWTLQVPLKSLLQEIKPNYIKCDIEGEEWRIPYEEWLGPEVIKIEFHILRLKETQCIRKITELIEFLNRKEYLCNIDSYHREQSLQISKTMYFTAKKKGRG